MKSKKETLRIAGMSCGHCVQTVSQALARTEGVAVERVAVGIAEIAYDPEQVSRETIVRAIDDVGFEVIG
jgi:copper chaperone